MKPTSKIKREKTATREKAKKRITTKKEELNEGYYLPFNMIFDREY